METNLVEQVINQHGKDCGSIKQILDRSLRMAKQMQQDRADGEEVSINLPNVMFTSAAGASKTAQVEQWAKENGLNLTTYKANSDEVAVTGTPMPAGFIPDPDDPNEQIPDLKNSAVHTFDGLERPNSILFLDEINRCRSDQVLNILLGLVQRGQLLMGGSKVKEYPNLLFCVAAVNPSNDDDDYIGTRKLDKAFLNRFYKYIVLPEPQEFMDHHLPIYQRKAEKAKQRKDLDELTHWNGAVKITKALCNDPRFKFTGIDTQEAKDSTVRAWTDMSGYRDTTSYRGLDMLMHRFDGTKDDFLDEWDSICDPDQLSIVEEILSGYIDVDDETAKSLAGGTDSDFFNKKGVSDIKDLGGHHTSAATADLIKKMSNHYSRPDRSSMS